MTGTDERPLRLDAPREEVLAHATELVVEAWRSFDRFRPEEPVLDARIRALLGAAIPEGPVPAFEMLDDAARILDASIAQPRPRYFAFIGSSGLEMGAIADLLAHTFDINLAADARAATELEQQAVRWVGELVGFPAVRGAFTSGGTISNVTALAAARERALPGRAARGSEGGRWPCAARRRCTTRLPARWSCWGSGARTSVRSRSTVCGGCGRRRSRSPSTRTARRALRRSPRSRPPAPPSRAPIDPLGALADVCQPRDVWLHVDGAYGLPAAAVPDRAPLFEGLDRVDSCSVDAHKWLYLPKACGVVMVRDADALATAFAHEEGYLPHQRHEPHAADITLEYSRPFRALKLWLAFRAHGAAQVRDAIARNLAEADLLYRRAQVTEDFEVQEATPQLSIVPIRHAPPGVTDLNAHNQALAELIQRDGRVYLASALIDDRVWLRPCFVNFRTTEEDVLALLDVARELGERLVKEGA